MKKLQAIVISGLLAAVSLTTYAGKAFASEKGFSPAYIGVGVTEAFDDDSNLTEGSIMGAYRAKAINAPVTIRGYLLPAYKTEAGVELTYDYGVARNVNAYVGPGFISNDEVTYPTVGAGVEWNQEGTPIVLFGSYKRAFSNDDFNLASFGIGYQF